MKTIEKVRAAVKALNFNNRQISIRESGNSSTRIDVKIKDLSIDAKAVKRAVDEYEKIDRCHASYEILSGGNTFIFVQYDSSVIREAAKNQLQRAEALIKANEDLKPGSGDRAIEEFGRYRASLCREDNGSLILKVYRKPVDWESRSCFCLDTIATYSACNSYQLAESLVLLDHQIQRLKKEI